MKGVPPHIFFEIINWASLHKRSTYMIFTEHVKAIFLSTQLALVFFFFFHQYSEKLKGWRFLLVLLDRSEEER